jgi:hypothetical protein
MAVAAKKKVRGPILSVDKTLITEEARERIRKEAEVKISDERRLAAEDALREEMLAEERAKFDPTEEMERVTIDIPAYSDKILIDGVAYYHGEVVPVTRKTAASIREHMGRMWELERTSGNPNISHYKPVKEDSFSALSAGAGNFARV